MVLTMNIEFHIDFGFSFDWYLKEKIVSTYFENYRERNKEQVELEEKIHKERFIFDFPRWVCGVKCKSRWILMRNNQCCESGSWSDRICIILPDPDPYPFQPNIYRLVLVGWFFFDAASAAKRMSVHGCGHLAQLSGPAPPTLLLCGYVAFFYMLSLFRPVLGWKVYCSSYPQLVEKRSFSLSQACMFVVSDWKGQHSAASGSACHCHWSEPVFIVSLFNVKINYR